MTPPPPPPTAVVVAFLVAACGSGEVTVTSLEIEPRGGAEVEAVVRDQGTSTGQTETPAAPDQPSDDAAALSALAAAITPIGRAAGLDDLGVADGPAPVSIDLPDIGVAEAPVVATGVEPNGEMSIPGADEVGWYRYGPRPGDEGSSVLAAHIAFDGRDGVFRHLADVEPGQRFSVTFDDGSVEEFVVIGLRQWSKDEIPLDDLFTRQGTPRLVLITCGGTFNPSLSSYDDNIVVIAVPLGFALGET